MKKLIVLFLFPVLMLLAGCAPTVMVNGERFEALTPREERKLVELARYTLAANRRIITAEERSFIQKNEPQLQLIYKGDRQGDAKIFWECPKRRIYVVFSGELLTPRMQAMLETLDRQPEVLDFTQPYGRIPKK